MHLRIIHNRHIYFIFSATLVISSILALSIWGLKWSIDFTGGSLLEVNFKDIRPSASEINTSLTPLQLGAMQIQPAEENAMIIRMKELSEADHQALISNLKNSFGAENIIENRFESIGPVIGQKLKSKTIVAILLAIILIIAYIAYAFRHVSKPVASWKYGVSAIIALAHDIIIVTGIFSIMGHFLGTEVGILFVTALLTILGYSVNDTIVVFDRIRENLIYRPKDTFIGTINHSINETIARSINTSFTVLLVLLCLYFFGGASIKDFTLALIFGIIFGTYSSIFIASPFLVIWQKLGKTK